MSDRLKERDLARSVSESITRDTIGEHMGEAIDHFNNDRLQQARAIFAKISDDFPDYSGTPQALATLALT